MPYVTIDDRETYHPKFKVASFPGQLNYQITVLITEYIKKHGLKYQNINDVIGALEGAKLEFYRRAAAPYESIKIEENGDGLYE
jgi:hypothetical protein